MATLHLHRRLLLTAWLLGSPVLAQAQTPPAESDLLARIAAQPQQVSNYLELAKLYDQARRFDDELAMLRRAIDVVRAQQGIITFTPAATGQPRRFAPVLLNGRPVELVFTVSVQFKPR